ncbi:(Fe-S)-binding protein [Thermosulfuriphilus sp.]
MDNKLLSQVKPRLEASACHLDRPCYRITATLEKDIRKIMPYVNAVAKVLLYEPEDPVIIFRLKGYRVALRPEELTVGTVSDWTEAQKALETVVSFLNDVWQRREGIIPDHRPKKRPPALEIYKLLPKTNCRACGEASCLAFATKLALGRVELGECLPLEEQPEAKSKLLRLIGGG